MIKTPFKHFEIFAFFARDETGKRESNLNLIIVKCWGEPNVSNVADSSRSFGNYAKSEIKTENSWLSQIADRRQWFAAQTCLHFYCAIEDLFAEEIHCLRFISSFSFVQSKKYLREMPLDGSKFISRSLSWMSFLLSAWICFSFINISSELMLTSFYSRYQETEPL